MADLGDVDVLLALHRSPLFADFPAPAVETLATYFDLMEGGRGDRLYAQGDEGGGLYVVVAGSLDAQVIDIEGRERTVGRIQAPDSFGELALILRGQRLVTVQAVDRVVLLELSYDGFRRLKVKNPDLCLMLIMAIVRRFGHVLDDSRDLLQRLLLRQLAGRTPV